MRAVRAVRGDRLLLALLLGAALTAAGSKLPVGRTPDVAASSAASGPVLLLQHNFCGGSDCAGTDSQKVTSLVDAVLSRRPAVVALEEVCAQQLAAVRDTLRRRGLAMNASYLATFPAGRGRCGGQSFGLAILSVASVSDVRSTVFAAQTSGLEKRSMLCVRTTLGGDARVCATHLAPGNAAASVRAQQVDEAVDVLAGFTEPTVLLGDLNTWPGDDALDAVYDRSYGGGAVGGYDEGGSVRDGRRCRCGTATRAGVKLDFVFVEHGSFDARASWVQDAPYSDHHRLWAPTSPLG